MPKKIEITCCECKKDITYTYNCMDYRISLSNENIQPSPRAKGLTTLHIEPRLPDNYYFCSVKCLKQLVERL